MSYLNFFNQSDVRTERIFNLFLFVEHGVITTYGATYHKMTGTENKKLAYLQLRVTQDVAASRRFSVPKSFELFNTASGTRKFGAISIDAFYELATSGRHLEMFEEAFAAMNAPRDPLVCITPVVDGVVTVDGLALLIDPNLGHGSSLVEAPEHSHE